MANRKMDRTILETRFVLNTRPFDFSKAGDGSEIEWLHDLIRTELTSEGFEEGDDFFLLIPGRTDPGYGEVMLVVTNISCALIAAQYLHRWQYQTMK